MPEPNGTAVPTSLDVEAPAPEPAAQAASAPETPAIAPREEESPFDASALEATLKSKFGPDISLKTLDKWVDKLHKTNSKLGRELAEYKKANEPKDAFWKMIDQNEEMRMEMASVVEKYEQANPGVSSQANFQNLDLAERLNRIEMENLVTRTESEISALEARGWPVDEAMRDEITAAVLESRGGVTPKGVYMAKYGDILLEHERRKAAEDAVAAIKMNNNSYVPAAPQRGQAAATSPAQDVSKMTASEFAAYATQRIAKGLS
ncbi:MAG: hypothetical protein OEV86_12925 [Candidatus Krumholzibacteria bacterium]|nr:hypothetical protein [Candidatus Krumholzibacteria bacterium]